MGRRLHGKILEKVLLRNFIVACVPVVVFTVTLRDLFVAAPVRILMTYCPW